MADSQLVEKYKAQAELLESQRSWFTELAQQTSVDEQRKRCSELAQKLAEKIAALQQRIACLQ